MLVMGALLIMSFGTGCATLVRGDSQKVKFETDPANATVNVDGKDYKAPCEVTLKRKEPHTVVISAPGYQTIAVDVASHWDGASMGNVVMPGGSVGLGVDTLNGADKSFYQMATIKLNKSNNPTATQPATMYMHRGVVMTKAERDKAVAAEQEYRRDTDQ